MLKDRRLVVDNKKTGSFQHKLTGFHKVGVLVLLAFIVSQSLIILNVADAGDMTAKSLLACTNAIRLKYQKNELVINDKLNTAAQKKLEDMIKDGYWAHENPSTHKKPWDFVDAAGYYYETTGENLALGFEDAQSACNAWEKSKSHLANISDATFQEVGFAVDKANLHKNGKGILIVQMFGSRKDFATTVKDSGSTTNNSSTQAVNSGSNRNPDGSGASGSGDLQGGGTGTGNDPGLAEHTESIDLHAAGDEATLVDQLKIIMPYITGLFYVTTIIVMIFKGTNKKKTRNGFAGTIALFLAISSIFSTLVYLVLT